MRFLSFLSFSSSRGILELFVRHLSCTGIFSFISNEHSISSKVYTQFLQNCYFSKPGLLTRFENSDWRKRFRRETLPRSRSRGWTFPSEVARWKMQRERERSKIWWKGRGKKERKKEKSDGKKNKREKGVTNERGILSRETFDEIVVKFQWTKSERNRFEI